MKLIDKDTLVAEIEKRINFNKTLNSHSRLDECKAILSFIDTLEVKEVDDTEYWLVSVRYALNGCDTESNCFFAYFPAKQDIQNAIGAERYTILHIQNLTEEQFSNH